MAYRYKDELRTNSNFKLRDGVFFQARLDGVDVFTKTYLDIREREQRLHDDATVRLLPNAPFDIRNAKEWPIRKRSADRLVKYLSGKGAIQVVEIGCGNGWLINYLSQTLSCDFCGVDINEPELLQAARLFSNDNKTFAHADILSPYNTVFKADVFVLAGAVQYFEEFPDLINTLLSLLYPGGEIHILDSPFYHDRDIAAAKERSKSYFMNTGVEAMQDYYFHQSWESLQQFNFQILYDPTTPINRLRRLVSIDSPFPWLKITTGKAPY